MQIMNLTKLSNIFSKFEYCYVLKKDRKKFILDLKCVQKNIFMLLLWCFKVLLLIVNKGF